MKRGWACKIFHLRKNEGHQLFKTQHVSWLHYHIMDYWCDCQWGNCHLCLLCDGFLPDCRMWRTVKGPSFLISRPLKKKNKNQHKKKKQTAMIWRGCFAHKFTAIQCAFICWNKPLCDRYIKISHGWLQTEVFLGCFLFRLIAIYARICLRTRLDDNGPGLNAGAAWNMSHLRRLLSRLVGNCKFTIFLCSVFI